MGCPNSWVGTYMTMLSIPYLCNKITLVGIFWILRCGGWAPASACSRSSCRGSPGAPCPRASLSSGRSHAKTLHSSPRTALCFFKTSSTSNLMVSWKQFEGEQTFWCQNQHYAYTYTPPVHRPVKYHFRRGGGVVGGQCKFFCQRRIEK